MESKMEKYRYYELVYALKSLKLSLNKVAEQLEVNKRTIYRYLEQEQIIPEYSKKHLRVYE